MEASAALDTLCEQLRKAQQKYLYMLQQSFQFELDILNCLETECTPKKKNNLCCFPASTSTTTTLRIDECKPSSPPLLEMDVFGPLALYETNHGMSPKTSSIKAWQKCSLAHQSVLCNHLPDIFYNYLKAFFFGRALLSYIKLKYKQQTLCNKPQDITAAFEFTVLNETEFPQPSSKDKHHTKSSQRQSLPHTMGAVCTHCKLHNYTEDQCQKKAHRLQWQASLTTSATSASSSTPTTHNPMSTLLQQTCMQPSANQSSPSSCSFNFMSFTQQQSNIPEQQDFIRGEEEYNKFFESQQALNSITVTNDMPGPNDPICTLMTINGCCVTAVIDSGTSHSFMDPSIIDLVHAKTKQANYMVKLGHHETIATYATKTEPLAIGFGKHYFHHMFSILPQPDSQSIILGRDFMHKSSMGITDIPINYPEEPLPHSTNHDITQHQLQLWLQLSRNTSASAFSRPLRNTSRRMRLYLLAKSPTLISRLLSFSFFYIPPSFLSPLSLFLGCTLKQRQRFTLDLLNNKHHHVMIVSKALNPAQCNYPASKCKMLTILFTICSFSDWLYSNKFMIYLNHKALSYLFTSNNKNYTLNYWAILISKYISMIIHHPGVHIILKDCFS
ncbi:hypothetical protein QOT17_018830 [Balamuthia mandrillaris]